MIARAALPHIAICSADALFTTDWVAVVAKRRGTAPQRQDFETPMVVESAEQRLVAAE